MPSPRFPAMSTLLDSRVCPLIKFDALFLKITQERRILDGYFLQSFPDETRLLFVVNGAPYGAGRIAGGSRSFLEIHEFFAAYSEQPEAPLSFLVADKRLLLGLMVLFQHRPVLTHPVSGGNVTELLEKLAARDRDAILGLASPGGEWGVSIWTKGRLAANYFPPSGTEAAKEGSPDQQLQAYASMCPDGLTIEVYDQTRAQPAEDVGLITPETRGRLSEVFLQVAFKVKEAESGPQLELEVTPEPSQVVPAASPAGETAPAPAMEAAPAAPAPEPTMAVPELSRPSPAPTPPSVSRGPVPEIVLYTGDRQLGVFSLAQGELTIGRTTGNAIFIDNPGVSRRHAVIRMVGDSAVIEDLGSANGTFVGGERITRRDLKDGDEITLVKHRLVFRVPKGAETASKVESAADAGQKTMFIDQAAVAQAMAARPAPRGEGATPVLRPRLILPDLKKFALESEEVTLGTGADCQVQLSGMFVAKAHARIIPQKEGRYKIVHLGGLLGTRVNGEKISEHTLKHGDEIEIGKQKLLFRLER